VAGFEPAKAGFHHSAEMAGIPEAGAVSMLDNTPAGKKKKEALFKYIFTTSIFDPRPMFPFTAPRHRH
jgi:hypothetical protein